MAGSFPWPLQLYVGWLDRLQFWMIHHGVGTRHQEHRVFAQFLERDFPPRAVGEKVEFPPYSVTALQSPGVAGWIFPRLNIIDTLGLNDWVAARTPPYAGRLRFMAHERSAPREYYECFSRMCG